jgi:hypothetical protein
MPHLRFTALAAALFVIAYGGVAWLLAGAPRLSPMGGLSTPAMPHGEATSVPAREAGPRDALRLAALQASKTYALSPCDKAAKASIIEAVSAYATAWREMMGCGPDGCDRHNLNAAAAAFSTPLDTRLREALAAAFAKRGISIDDFPSALRINVAMLVPGRGDGTLACPETRADRVR